jgi:hypothetical protein
VREVESDLLKVALKIPEAEAGVVIDVEEDVEA